MKNLRQVFLGIIIALASIGLLLGVFSLSLAEAGLIPSPAPTQTSLPTLPPTASPTWLPFTPAAHSATPTPSPSITPTPTLPPPPTNCPPPLGWVPYITQPGDTLDNLAVYYRTSSANLQRANCLLTTGLPAGVLIYVPRIPTQTPVPCGPPYNWILYIVQPGDTLYRLSLAYGIAVADLQRANCLGYSTLLHPGQRLYVPAWATRTPFPTLPLPATSTSLPTDTPVPTLQPSDTPVPAASDTPIEVPTDTPVPNTARNIYEY